MSLETDLRTVQPGILHICNFMLNSGYNESEYNNAAGPIRKGRLMSKSKAIKWKSILVAIVGLALFACASLILKFFTVPVVPITYEAPPEFIQEPVPSAPSIAMDTDKPAPAPKLSSPASDEIEMLAREVFFEGESPELFLALFGHPDEEVRASAARALARYYAANVGMVEPHTDEPEISGRTEFMDKFWADADKTTILKVLSEVISTSVETGGAEFQGDDQYILLLLAWFPGLSSERAEVLTWVADHHPKDNMRLSAAFSLLNDNFPRKIGDEVLDSRTHDPSFKVRFGAWKELLSRIPSGFLGG